MGENREKSKLIFSTLQTLIWDSMNRENMKMHSSAYGLIINKIPTVTGCTLTFQESDISIQQLWTSILPISMKWTLHCSVIWSSFNPGERYDLSVDFLLSRLCYTMVQINFTQINTGTFHWEH